MKIAYIPVSTQEQNTIRQEVLMESLGVNEVYIDRMSGKNTNRPELQRLVEYVRHGDTVIVESITRFARNTRNLLELVERLAENAGSPSSAQWRSWSGTTFFSAKRKASPLPNSRENTAGERHLTARNLKKQLPDGAKAN